MKTSFRLALVSLPLVLAGTAFAQPADSAGHRRGPHGPRGNAAIRVLDADRNHELSAAEIAGAAAALRTLDADNDGTVAATELRPARPARPADAPARPERPAGSGADTARPVDPVMLALDADKNGSLSAGELNNAAASLAALDLNKDGKLTADEFRPLPPEGATTGRGPRR